MNLSRSKSIFVPMNARKILTFQNIFQVFGLPVCCGYAFHYAPEYEKDPKDICASLCWLVIQIILPTVSYWMWKHSGIFKGYSKTAQEFLTKYRQLVLEGMRNDAKNNLNFLLAESGFQTWKKRHFYRSSANELEQIKKYIRSNERSKNPDISEHFSSFWIACLLRICISLRSGI